jgi:hypothetical protein
MAKKKVSGSRSRASGSGSSSSKRGRSSSVSRGRGNDSPRERNKSAYESPALRALRRLARDVKDEVRSDLNRRVRTAPPIPPDRGTMDDDMDMPVRSPRDDVREYLDRIAPTARDKLRKPLP